MALGFMKAAVLSVSMGLGLASQAHSITVGLITVCDGPVDVVRGGARFEAREGMALQAQDIVRTLPGARMARLETSLGAVIDLGPETQLLLHPATTPWQGERAALGYLATGWAKVSAGTSIGVDTGAAGLATASVHVAPMAASVVLVQAQVQREGAAAATHVLAFVEAGSAQLHEYAAAPQGKKIAASGMPKAVQIALGEGQAYRRSPTQTANRLPGDLLVRASAGLLSQVPSALKDSLPRRAARFSPATAPQPTYLYLQGADLSVWTHVAEPLRSHMARRFAMPAPTPTAQPAVPAHLAESSAVEAVIAHLLPARNAAAVGERSNPAKAVRVASRRKTNAGAASSPVNARLSMLYERDASVPTTINATKPGEAAARLALPETNTRIAEADVALSTAQALPPVAAPSAPGR